MFALVLLTACFGEPDPEPIRIEGVTAERAALTLTLDPSADTFEGEVVHALSFHEATRRLRLHAKELEILEASLTAGDRTQPVTSAPDGDEFVALSWGSGVDGPATLTLRYRGKVVVDGQFGLFRVESGGAHHLTSQMEPEDARRVVPGLDQPSTKVPWTVTLRVPDGLGAFANAPEVSRTDDGAMDVVTFAPTPPLPTYLLALAVGPYHVVDGGTGGAAQVPIRYLMPQGTDTTLTVARRTTGPVLTWLEDWFDEPYPYAKLDIVGIPHSAQFGAMENPGLVVVNTSFLLDGELVTERQQDAAVELMAHELAHMWFGNLVTPAWWDDLWLNESFATWMAAKALEGVRPEADLAFARYGSRARAMRADRIASARQVHDPVETHEDVKLAFDGITYAKGRAVLEMVERWLGEDTFQQGVRAHIDQHPHGVATTAEFLAALGSVTDEPVEEVLGAFVDQPGLPIVDARASCGDGTLTLTQSRFLPGEEDPEGRWPIPVRVALGQPDGGREVVEHLLREASETVPLPGACPPAWIVPNAEATGYYRGALTEEGLATLVATEGLPEIERLSILGDAAALANAGDLPPTALLQHLDALLADSNPTLVDMAAGVIDALEQAVDDEHLELYARFVRGTLRPQLDALGLEVREEDTDAQKRLRDTLVRSLGTWGDPEVRAWARARMERDLANPGETPTGDPELANAYMIGVLGGDRALYDRLGEAGFAEQDTHRRRLLLAAMASIDDPRLMDVSMERARTDDDLSMEDRMVLVVGPLLRRNTRGTAWNRIADDMDEVQEILPLPLRFGILGIGNILCTPEERARYLEVFDDDRIGWWVGASTLRTQTLDQMDQCISRVAAQQESLHAYLVAWNEARDQAEAAEPER